MLLRYSGWLKPWIRLIHGSLSQFQQQEEEVRRGHSITPAIRNDVAEVLLAFFIPWDQIAVLFSLHCPDHAMRADACSHIWGIMEPTLPPHLRQYARNFSLIHKSKEEVAIDMSLRAMETGDTDFVDDPAIMSDDDSIPESSLLDTNTSFSKETLLMACHHIMSTWYNKDLMVAQTFGNLRVDWSHPAHLKEQNLTSTDLSAYPSSEIRFLPEQILQQWERQLKTLVSFADTDDSADVTEDFMGSLSNDIDVGLRPLLPEDDLAKVQDLQLLLDEDPSENAVIDLVSQMVPLNRKQRLVVKKIIQEALAWKDHPYDFSKRDQFLQYVRGEGGTGKTRIIKAIVVALTLLRRQHEVVLTAPTGSAADNIKYHTALGLGIGKRVNSKAPERIRRLWVRKTIFIIDEISMVDLKTLSDINHRCKIARALSADSPDLFGGLPVVIFTGDFYQFPPVKGLPLWQEPRFGKDDEFEGRQIWRRFTNVILLDQRMRQAEDLEFQDFLH
jgi:PIF1-like helicase